MAESNASLVKRIETFIKSNLVEDALNELERCISMNYHGLKKEVILLKSRCEDIRSRKSHGIIDFKEESIELNKIKSSIIDLLDRLRIEIQKIDISETTLKERLENSKLKTEHKQQVFNSWAGFVLGKLSYLILPTLLICLLYFVSTSDCKNALESPLSFDAKFRISLDKDSFEQARILADWQYLHRNISKETWEGYKREIFNRQTDFLLKLEAIDSVATLFLTYRFDYGFPGPGYRDFDYNEESRWFNFQIEKSIPLLCRLNRKELGKKIIQIHCRPLAEGEVQKVIAREGGYQKNYKTRDDLLKLLDSMCR